MKKPVSRTGSLLAKWLLFFVRVHVVAASSNHYAQTKKYVSKWCHGVLLIKSIPQNARTADDIRPISS